MPAFFFFMFISKKDFGSEKCQRIVENSTLRLRTTQTDKKKCILSGIQKDLQLFSDNN